MPWLPSPPADGASQPKTTPLKRPIPPPTDQGKSGGTNHRKGTAMKLLLRFLEAVFPGPPDDIMAIAEAVGVAKDERS